MLEFISLSLRLYGKLINIHVLFRTERNRSYLPSEASSNSFEKNNDDQQMQTLSMDGDDTHRNIDLPALQILKISKL